METSNDQATHNVMYKDPSLPHNWKREIIEKPGKSRSRYEVTILSPDGKSFKTISQLDKYLKSVSSDLKASEFDFSLYGKSQTPRKKRKSAEDDIIGNTRLEKSPENDRRRRSGRIQMKLRSQESDEIDSNAKPTGKSEKSPSKSVQTPTPPKKRRSKKEDIIENSLATDAPIETVATVHQETTTTTTTISEDDNGKEVETMTVVVQKSDVDIISNQDPDKTLKILEHVAEDIVIPKSLKEGKVEELLESNNEKVEIAEIEVNKKIVETSQTMTVISNSEEVDHKDKSHKHGDHEHTKHDLIHSKPLENGSISLTGNNQIIQNNIDNHDEIKIDQAESNHSIYSIKQHSIISQSSAVLETSTN